MVHSGKVQAVQFGPRPKICVAIFFTEFRVDVLSCYLTDNRKIKPGMLQFARAEHDTKKKKSILIICNRQSNWYGATVCYNENYIY